jgi:membrane protein implicated in regulation of membrane protease activity
VALLRAGSAYGAGMLYVIGVILLALWVLGVAMKATYAAIHLLLVLAVAAMILGFMWSRARDRPKG